MRKSVRKSNESAFQFIVIARICFAEDGLGIDDSIQRREQQLFAFNEIFCCKEWMPDAWTQSHEVTGTWTRIEITIQIIVIS